MKLKLKLSNAKIFSSLKHPNTKEEIFYIEDVDGDIIYLTKEDIEKIATATKGKQDLDLNQNKKTEKKQDLDLDQIQKFVDDIKKMSGDQIPKIDPFSPIGDLPTVPNTRPTFWYATYKCKES